MRVPILLVRRLQLGLESSTHRANLSAREQRSRDRAPHRVRFGHDDDESAKGFSYRRMRSPSQEDQLRIDRRHSKGSERSKSRPRSSVSYSTDAYRGWYREKDEAPKGQRWMGRRTGSSALLEHHRLPGSHATLKRRLDRSRKRSIATFIAHRLYLASPHVSVDRSTLVLL